MDSNAIDCTLFFLFNRTLSNGICDVLMPALSARGYLLFLPLVGYMIWQGFKNKRENLHVILWAISLALCAFLLADWAGMEIKKLLGRERPCTALEDVRLLVGCGSSSSMPSNHAGNAFAFSWPIYRLSGGILSRAWRLYPIVIACLIALSRPYVGAHYPGDILAGAVLGVGIASILILTRPFVLRGYAAMPYRTILYCALAGLSLFRVFYILHGPLDLSPDEAHYWEWSRRLDLSYYSKGPMIAYLIYLGTFIMGDSEFSVRILAVIFNALSCLLVFRLATQLCNEEHTALLASLLMMIIPLFSTYGIVFTIDSPFIFFWTLSLVLFWKAAGGHNAPADVGQRDIRSPSPQSPLAKGGKESGDPLIWIALGVVIGLGLLTKYTMAFFLPCGFLFLLFSDSRFLLKTPFPYLAAAVSLAIFSPVIIWNFQHDWLTLRHTAGQANVAAGLSVSLKTFAQFAGSQAGVLTPLFFAAMIYGLCRLGQLFPERQARFVFFFSAPVLLFFLLKSFQGKVQANWALTGYITLLISTAHYFGKTLREHASGKTSGKAILLFRAAIVLAIIISAASYFPSLLRVPVKLDPSARLRGWEQLGREVSKIREALQKEGATLLFSDSYQIASELAFYTEGRPETFCINLGRRMNQYDLWPSLNDRAASMRPADRSEMPRAVHALFVRQDDAPMPPEVAPACGSHEKYLVTITDKWGPLRQYSVFVCYNFSGISLEKPQTF